MIDAIFRRLTAFARHGRLPKFIALVLAIGILALVLLAHGFIAALLWDHWHPVAGIIWLLFGSGMATAGSRWADERERRRDARDLARATRASGGDHADR